jgi:RNA polymerase sigma-70 factor, ECF subfamily
MTTGLGDQFSEVLQAARAGADWAWERLYESLAPAVLGYLRGRSAPDPEGLCGDVFCQLVRDIHWFQGDERSFRSWLFVIVHHRFIDDARRRNRRPESLGSPEALDWITEPNEVEGEAMRRSRDDEIRALIEELTPAQRDVLLLRILGGLTIEEVAKAVGRRAGAVKALQRRGLEALRTKLEMGAYPFGPEER